MDKGCLFATDIGTGAHVYGHIKIKSCNACNIFAQQSFLFGFINGFLDLMSLFFMSKFGKKPMHFFGLLGVLSFFIGAVTACWILIDKLICVIQNQRAPLVTDNPIFYIGLVAMIIGTQLFLAGFIGELVSRSNPERNNYNIKETTD